MEISVVQLELHESHKIEIPLSLDKIFIGEQAAPIFCKLIGNMNVEHASILCLDSSNKIINYFTVSIGEINCVKVSLAQMFRTVLLSNASKIVVAHNHPSHILEITSNDIDMTRKIAFISHCFSLELIDSLIVSGDKYISMRVNCKENFDGQKSKNKN